MHARASTAGADSLKIQQRSWIGQREQCKGKADPTGCLLSVYQQRRTELTAAVAGEASEGAAGDTSARGRLPTLTADVVWHGDSSRIYQQCQFGDDPCARRVMKAEGASEQALRLAERIDGWADGFQELGPVDVITAVGTYAANTLEYLFLVNGTPDLIALHEYELTAADRARPDVQQVLRRLPDGLLFSHRSSVARLRRRAPASSSRPITRSARRAGTRCLQEPRSASTSMPTTAWSDPP